MIEKKRQLVFSGGGGGSSSQTDTPNNLFSEDTGEVLLGLCEGPIEGLQDGGKTFYLDDTPLLASDGSENYKDVYLDLKKGNLTDDEVIQLQLGGSARPTNVGLELKKDAPITRVTQSGEIDYIDVRIIVQQLYKSTKDGMFNSNVSFRIEYKKTTETPWHLYNNAPITISGKTTSNYARDYRITVEKDPNANYEIRVTKISNDSPDGSFGDFNKIYFGQFEEIVALNRRFDNTAIAHLIVRTSDQVAQMPTFSGLYKCLKIKVPSNYDPETRIYSGEWDGTFKIAYTDNPAWCLYDLIMNDRYGVNAYYEVEADKWDFYEAAKYCDELVPDGRGGTEPRYTLNICIDEAKSGPELLNYIAAVFNATLYEDGSDFVRLSYDKYEQATHLFTKENITSEGFTYSFSDPSTRYNDYTVTFLNSESNWEEDRRRVCDQEHIDKWGRTTYDFEAVGCIKASEAIRRARFHLISGLTEVMTVTFKTNRVAQNINVFDTILISDPSMNYAMSGRIKSIEQNRTTVQLRDPVFLEAGSYYAMKIQSTEGVVEVELDVQEVGSVTTLYLMDKLPDTIPEKAVFSLEGTDDMKGFPKPFRVLSISEDTNDVESMSVTAVEINRNKQYEADYGLDLTEQEPDTRPSYFEIPHALGAVFNQAYIQSTKENQLIIGLTLDYKRYPYYNGRFRCYSRLKAQEGEPEQEFIEREVVYGDTIINHPGGLHEFILLPYSIYGTTPPFDSAPIFEYDVLDLYLPPEDVRNFRAEPNINNIVLKWDPVSDVDIAGYQIRLGDEWETAEIIAELVSDTSFTYTTTDNGELRFLIKAIDSFGNYSENAAFTSGALSPPKDVTNFYVTPNLDSIRFDWVVEPENGVEYEVRAGNIWESGLFLFKTKGTNQTILHPTTNGIKGYMIKGVSSAGVYSKNFRYAEGVLALKQNRNVLYEIDNAAAGWEGTTYGFEPTQYPDVLAMQDGVYYAEHYFEVNLPETIRSRNWYECEGFKFGQRMTFDDLDYTWGSVEAERHNWLNSSGLETVSGDIQAVIAYGNSETFGGYIGFSYNKTLADFKGFINPYFSYEVRYGPSRYLNGVVVNKLVNVRYRELEIPEKFSIRFKMKLTRRTPDYLRILRLRNEAGDFLDVAIEAFNIVARRSDGVETAQEIRRYIDTDFLAVMVTQTEDKIILDYWCEYANIKGRIETDTSTTPKYTKLYIGGIYEDNMEGRN